MTGELIYFILPVRDPAVFQRVAFHAFEVSIRRQCEEPDHAPKNRVIEMDGR
jgi:hypothetical protein